MSFKVKLKGDYNKQHITTYSYIIDNQLWHE